MSAAPPEDNVVRVALKRANLWELVQGDPLLAENPFLRALGPVAEKVMRKGVALRYPPQSVLFQQGDASTSLYFVIHGEVRLSARPGKDVVELGNVTRGEVCGEAEILSGAPLRASSAIAHSDAAVGELPRETLMQDGKLLKCVADFLAPIQTARSVALSEMTDFLNRW